MYLKNTFDTFRADADVSFKEYNLLEKLKAFNADTNLKSRLIALLEKEKDKFVNLRLFSWE